MGNESINPANVNISVLAGYAEFKPLCKDPDISAEDFSVYAFAFIYGHYCQNFGVIRPESPAFLVLTSLVSKDLAALLKSGSSESIQEAILRGDWN